MSVRFARENGNDPKGRGGHGVVSNIVAEECPPQMGACVMAKSRDRMTVAEYLGNQSADPETYAARFDRASRDALASMGITNGTKLHEAASEKGTDVPCLRTCENAFNRPHTMTMRTYDMLMKALGQSFAVGYDLLDDEGMEACEANREHQRLYDEATERMLLLICAFTRLSADRQDMALRMVQAAGGDADGPHKVVCDYLRERVLGRFGRLDLLDS